VSREDDLNTYPSRRQQRAMCPFRRYRHVEHQARSAHADEREVLCAATLSETLPGMVHQLAIVALERFRKDALKTAGKCPERCLFS
jgi:hypothetical protein